MVNAAPPPGLSPVSPSNLAALAEALGSGSDPIYVAGRETTPVDLCDEIDPADDVASFPLSFYAAPRLRAGRRRAGLVDGTALDFLVDRYRDGRRIPRTVCLRRIAVLDAVIDADPAERCEDALAPAGMDARQTRAALSALLRDGYVERLRRQRCGSASDVLWRPA